jgi:hypothetical protein
MFRHLRDLLVLTIVLAGLLALPSAAEPAPAAYVTAVELTGADSSEGTIRRDGALLRPKLLMGLYTGDEIFLREAGSRIAIEAADGVEHVISGANARFTVADDTVPGDGLWGMLDAVSEAIGGGSDEVIPDNMITRDDGQTLRIPMAVKGANHVVRSGGPIWIAWSGGTAPFRVTISAGETVTLLEGLNEREALVDVPSAAKSRFRVKVEDAGGRTDTILIRLEEKRPEPTTGGSAVGGLMREIAYASWLTRPDGGSWSIEAARLLKPRAGGHAAARLLLARIAEGWKNTAAPAD